MVNATSSGENASRFPVQQRRSIEQLDRAGQLLTSTVPNANVTHLAPTSSPKTLCSGSNGELLRDGRRSELLLADVAVVNAVLLTTRHHAVMPNLASQHNWHERQILSMCCTVEHHHREVDHSARHVSINHDRTEDLVRRGISWPTSRDADFWTWPKTLHTSWTLLKAAATVTFSELGDSSSNPVRILGALLADAAVVNAVLHRHISINHDTEPKIL